MNILIKILKCIFLFYIMTGLSKEKNLSNIWSSAPYPSTLPSMRRPPLPGYQEATNMARRQQQHQQQYHHYQHPPHHQYHLQQQQQQHRSYSHDNSNLFIGVGHGPVTGSDSDYDTPTADGEIDDMNRI